MFSAHDEGLPLVVRRSRPNVGRVMPDVLAV
jgi:hypothetical protein